MIHGDASWLIRGKLRGLWAPIDYDEIDRSLLYEDARDSHGVGILYWSFNIVYRTDVFDGKGPKSWSEVWKYAKENPGRVALWGARPNYVLEAALMANGYKIDDVYPLNEQKIDEAFRSLDEVRENVVWYETGAQGARLLTSGEVDVAMFYGGDAFGLIDEGEALAVEWNQGIYTRDYWLVPANAPNRKGAMKLIEFALDAQRQATFAEVTGFGPVNPDSSDLVGEEFVRRLASYRPNKDLELSYDYEWWGERDDQMLDRWNTWLRG